MGATQLKTERALSWVTMAVNVFLHTGHSVHVRAHSSMQLAWNQWPGAHWFPEQSAPVSRQIEHTCERLRVSILALRGVVRRWWG